MSWTERDLEDFATRGIAVDEVERQLAVLREPPRSIELVRPATSGDGIVVVPQSEIGELSDASDRVAAKGRVRKLVPASGAATRMFRDLTPALDPDRSLDGAPSRFFRELPRFAFAEHLSAVANDHGIDLGTDLTESDRRTVLRLLLTDEGLGYEQLAKGLIEFHQYPTGPRTAFEEQLREGAHFVSDGTTAKFHFTIPQTDLGRFSTDAKRLTEVIRDEFGIEPEIEFSVQHPATDTIAITPDGEPFREPDGRLLFRPGGHGALLRNLGELDGDIVFIKNIDNIRPSGDHERVARWYRVLVGYLARVEDRVSNTLRAIDEDGDTSLTRALSFVTETFGRPWRGDRADREGIRAHIVDVLSRPIRVCAVVRNEGEPGGAPFWVRDRDGSESLQIVESSQIDTSDSKQRKIFGSSTHFNPVALACSLRRDGKSFDLRRFVDPSTAFVARKSHQGRELIALEHPGLWNGGMAHWSSLFVELPSFTFAPVKTVFDLLRDEHQPGGELR